MSEIKIIRGSKRKFTMEEKRNYYEAWKESELNTIEFCKMHDISKSSLYKWSRRFEKEKGEATFTPILIKDSPPLKSIDKVALTIVFNNGPLQVNLEVPEHRLVSLIQEMSHATTIVR